MSHTCPATLSTVLAQQQGKLQNCSMCGGMAAHRTIDRHRLDVYATFTPAARSAWRFSPTAR